MADIRTDLQSRLLYAADASMYQVVPEAVAFPDGAAEIASLLQRARENRWAVTPRAAATSLAGQTIGPGLILDTARHMTRILQLDPERRLARVEPGVIRDTLNAAAAPFGLHFAPDPATSNRCMIGGMIGNNSSGSFSLRYGTTKDHVEKIEAVLASGETVVFEPVPDSVLLSDTPAGTAVQLARAVYALVRDHETLIRDRFPEPALTRSNAGYGLDRLLALRPFTPGGPPFSLVPLLCGSEGTLAVTTAAEVRLTPVANRPVLLVPQFSSINEAMEATVEALAFDPSAIELIDDQIIAATYGNPAMEPLRYFLKGSPKCVLIIQFDSAGNGDPLDRAEALAAHFREKRPETALFLETGAAGQKKIWDLRKAGLGLLMGLSAESKSPTFCEDTAVPVRNLPAYIRAFEEMLERYQSTCVFYAHASVGELHLRPVLDLKQPGNIARMETMQREITALVRKFGGTISGEHGDGRARSAFLEDLYGPDICRLFSAVKTIFDPEHVLNPGVIASPAGFTANLRYTPETAYRPLKTVFQWKKEGGFEEALERCNGAGVCRKLTGSGGTMCPSYRATLNERDSTRGRANLFRQVFSGKGPGAGAGSALKDALELCLGCKACKTECPAGVDMTRMKSEFLGDWHRKHGASRADVLTAFAHWTNPLFRFMPGALHPLIGKVQGSSWFKQLTGTDPLRTLPVPARRTFRADFKPDPRRAGKPYVLLFADHYTDVYEPETAHAAAAILRTLGYSVGLLPVLTAGRALISLGFPEAARSAARRMDRALAIASGGGIPVIGLEPSEVLTVRDDHPDLIDLQAPPDSLLQFEEFLLREHPAPLAAIAPVPGRDRVSVHGHCHAKALGADGALPELFQRLGFETTVWATGCCGMAGAFGYRHGALSMQIGEQSVFPKARAVEDDGLLCAPGFSCRHQIFDGTARQALHPARILAEAADLKSNLHMRLIPANLNQRNQPSED